MTKQLASISQQPFDYHYLKALLKNYRYPRNKISNMIKNNEIIPLKNGLYVLSEVYHRTLVPEQIANLLYGPSYISLEYAMAQYGFIPEEVYRITSVTTGRRKIYETRVGTFIYRQLKPEYYQLGYGLHCLQEQNYLIATPEKALCDKLYLSPGVNDLQELRQLLFEDLRIDQDRLLELDTSLIAQFAQAAKRKNLFLFKEYLDAYQR